MSIHKLTCNARFDVNHSAGFPALQNNVVECGRGSRFAVSCTQMRIEQKARFDRVRATKNVVDAREHLP
ncbi:MAG: hypothetical protein OEU90_06355, partial [Gammaproteobacteria bacterium]|nr:hypothetical protein [Gammaproteobacteria bacterium]